MDDVIMTITNILWEINYQKTAPFIASPQAVIYQLSNCYNQQYINCHCKNNLFYWCSLCLCNSAISFLFEVIVHKLVYIPLSNEG